MDPHFYLEKKQLKDIDAIVEKEFHITTLQLMEAAGIQTATFILKHLPKWKNILCCCGKGYNGGDGLIAARHLTNQNKSVTVMLLDRKEDLSPICKQHLEAFSKNNGTIINYNDSTSINTECYDGIIDALLGFSLETTPRTHYATAIQHMNKSKKPILSIDIPSGLNASTGIPHPPTIHADTTLSLGYPKKAYLNTLSHQYIGKLYLVDIGLPKKLYESISMKTPFQKGTPIIPLHK